MQISSLVVETDAGEKGEEEEEEEEEEELGGEEASSAVVSNSPFPKELENIPPLSSLRKVSKKDKETTSHINIIDDFFTHTLQSPRLCLVADATKPSSCPPQDGAVSPGVRYSVVNALYAYAFVVRRFHGRQEDLALEASEVGGALPFQRIVSFLTCMLLPSLPPLLSPPFLFKAVLSVSPSLVTAVASFASAGEAVRHAMAAVGQVK